MGVFEKFKDLVGIEEYDEDYEDDAALEKAEKTPEPAKPMPPQRKVMPETPLPGKVLPMSPKLPITGLSGAGDNPFKMVIIEPLSFEECPKLVDSLKAKRPIIINLEKIDQDLGKKVFDFLSGATYALNGTAQKVANNSMYLHLRALILLQSLIPERWGSGLNKRFRHPKTLGYKMKKRIVLITSILVSVFVDRMIKLAVMNDIPQMHTIEITKHIKLTHIRNYGAAFNFASGRGQMLVAVTAVTIVVMLYFFLKNASDLSPKMSVGLVGLLGGGLGNLIDRLYLGNVVDYISVGSFPVFNFADICITCGSTLVLLSLILSMRGKVED